MGARILIIDDEQPIRFSLRGIFEDEGHAVFEAENAEQGLEEAVRLNPDMAFMDIWMPGMDGLDALARLREMRPDLPVVMISGHGTIETAVRSIRLGAYDFIEKPLSLEKVLLVAGRALEVQQLRARNQALLAALPRHEELIGQSPAMLRLKEQLARVAPTDASVLLTGENGTGKELAAHALHAGSARAACPLVAVNCAAIPEELIESELFGHERGAFTGAAQARAGRFETAHKGTLFLDEIADMSLKTQAKILRILQERVFERVGGARPVHVDVRVIAATNNNLEEAIAAGAFREDLYYRLAVVPVRLPPLRERKGDIPLLTAAFAASLNHGRRPPVFSDEVLRSMERYAWPGNVRELRNFVERMSILHGGGIVRAAACGLPPAAPGPRTRTGPQDGPEALITPDMDFKSARTVFEAWYLRGRLRECNGNISRLAEKVGLERSYLHRKLKALDIDQ
jgi:two-component system nitrogen regulation response regulator NtrX